MKQTRRRFASAALVGLAPKSEVQIAGGFVFEGAGQGLDQGHRIRDHAAFRSAPRREKAAVVIVGGGVAGLSAAWQFDRRGFHDFVLLEAEPQAGGNARFGESEVTAYPWAAHYLPVPDVQQKLTRELCTELGLLDGHVWAERHLCHSPQERLFLHGRWQEGIEPAVGLTAKDAAQFRRFEELVGELRATGAFRIPMQEGLEKTTPRIAALDRMTLAEWMERQGLYSQYLRWFLDYSTRDDYGTHVDGISAWAGLHYFAAREPEDKGPLTWPEGNGWIVRRLLKKLGRHVRTGSMVHQVRKEGTKWLVHTEGAVYEAQGVVFAAPTWLAQWVVEPAPPRWPIANAPWVTANLHLHRWPESKGLEYAWDNVIYNSTSLGYVIATHQNLGVYQPKTVWTWYMALADGNAADQRRILLGGDYPYWREKILTDLERAHPEIRQCVSRIDIFRIGHAMPRPAPGAIFHPERMKRARPEGTLVYANCDLSGLSLFEEAQYRGVAAADHLMRVVSRGGA